MDDLIMLGPLIIKWSWVAILASGIIGYLTITRRSKAMKAEERKEILDTIGNSILLSIAIWKLSLILFNPISVINNPMVLLYFSGGYRGWILAIVVVYAYVFYRSKKQNQSFATYIQLFGLGFSSANVIYHFISSIMEQSDPIFHLGEILLSLIFAGWFYKGFATSQALVWLGIGQVFILFFKDVQVDVWLGLSREQLIFLVVSLIGFLGTKRINFNES